MKQHTTLLQTTIAFASKGQQFKILFQNFQSINNKQHILEAFIEQNPIYNAICISETWLTKEKLSMIQFSGYNVAASYCRSTRGGGGVCILLQDHFEYIVRNDITNMSIDYVIELWAIELPKENILLLTIYWNRREEVTFYSQLNIILNNINTKYSKHNVVIGDLSINILDTNVKTSQFLDLMLEFKYTQHIRKPTRTTQTTSTCIDLIFTNFHPNRISTCVEDLGFSDHSATTINISIPKISTSQTTFYTNKRSFNDVNILKFKSMLTTIDWNNIITTDQNVNDNYKGFHDTL